MITWAKLALAIVEWFSSLTIWFREESLRKQGATEVKAEIQQGKLEAIREANKARDEARHGSAAVPESDSLPDDGFRRD